MSNREINDAACICRDAVYRSSLTGKIAVILASDEEAALIRREMWDLANSVEGPIFGGSDFYGEEWHVRVVEY